MGPRAHGDSGEELPLLAAEFLYHEDDDAQVLVATRSQLKATKGGQSELEAKSPTGSTPPQDVRPPIGPPIIPSGVPSDSLVEGGVQPREHRDMESRFKGVESALGVPTPPRERSSEDPPPEHTTSDSFHSSKERGCNQRLTGIWVHF